MRGVIKRVADSRVTYRFAALPAVGYPLLLCWQRHWLPSPRHDATALLRDGRRLRCQLADRTQRTMYLGLFEPGESRLVRELLGPGDTFVDVGAHIGWFSTIAAGRVGETGQVVAIEPYPANATVLKDNLARNRCRNVRVLGSAVGSAPGTLTLARGADSGGVTALDWVRTGRVEVPVTTLDEALAGVGPVALLKIDVEGWEAQVLRGAARTLARAGRVLIEINPPALRRAGSSPEELSGILAEAGFTTFRPVVAGGLRRLHRTDIVNVIAAKAGAGGPGG
jgi:FkbM family methyltransferase